MGSPGVRVVRSVPLRLDPDPSAPTWDTFGDWAKAQKRPLAVDLFAGGGGLSLGLEDAGFRVAMAVDHDAKSVETHAGNFSGLSVGMDLSDLGEERRLIERLQSVDIALIAGGPPCQPFSRAGRSAIRHLVRQGKRESYDNRKDLWRVWLRIVLAVKPKSVLLENVPDMALGDDMRVIRQIVAALEAVGYETALDIVQAPDYGVPQHRQRLILVALRGDAPESFHWPAVQNRVTIWEAISDLPKLGDGFGEACLTYRSRKQTTFQARARARVNPDESTLVFDHVTRAVRDDDRAAFALMTSTTRYSDLPVELRRYRADTFDDKYKRHGKNELARSITAHIAKDGYWYIHPTELRTLTVREAARLQTFPDHYRFAGSRSDAFRQIGNAVPPRLAQLVGERILIGLGLAPRAISQLVGPQTNARRRLPAADLAESRKRLEAWAALDAKVAPWRHPSSDQWATLISSVLMTGRGDDGTIANVLWTFPTPSHLTSAALAEARLQKSTLRGLQRLLPAAQAWRDHQNSGTAGANQDDWLTHVQLNPAEAERFACLARSEDVLLTTQGPLRVAARVVGQPVDRKDRLTDGRMALALLVGSGEKAPARMAALAAVGAAVCTLQAPFCEGCPLVEICATAKA